MDRGAFQVELINAALRYAASGKPIFPCRPDKKPLSAHGFRDATTDEARIKAWWAAYPLAMIGMPTGKVSGIVVLDIDVGDERQAKLSGFQTLHLLGQLIPDSPLKVRTPSGGLHVYFRYDATRPLRNTAGKIGPGLDIRTDGGYVILPPSRATLEASDYCWDGGGDARC